MRGETNHRDLVNSAILAYEEERYGGDNTTLMCGGKFNRWKVIAHAPVLKPDEAEAFCKAIEGIGNAFTIEKEDLEKLALYILHESYTKEGSKVDFSGYYTRGDGGYGNIITDPFPCVCHDMLTDVVPEYATIFGINARIITGIVGLLSQGFQWQQVQEIACTHDASAVMAIENEYYKEAIKNITITHKLTFSQYCELKYGVSAFDVANIDQGAYDDYKVLSHHSPEECQGEQ